MIIILGDVYRFSPKIIGYFLENKDMVTTLHKFPYSVKPQFWPINALNKFLLLTYVCRYVFTFLISWNVRVIYFKEGICTITDFSAAEAQFLKQ
jgi:hypothetical protein